MTSRDRLLEGIPVAERRLRPAGVSTAVLEAGAGPPLVLLHGGIECGGVIWAPVIARLAEERRIVVPDVPGLGESEPTGRLDVEAFSDWFGELVDLTCEEPPAVVAHSLMGTLAVRFAARHGGRIGALHVYASPGIGPYHLPLGLRVVAMRFGLRPTERNAERFDRWAFADYDRARARSPGWFSAFSDYTRSLARVAHVKRTMRGLISTCTKRVPDSELRRIEVETTMLWGRHDRFVPLALAEAANDRLGWPLHVIEDSGHVPHIERPDRFLAALGASPSGPRSSRSRLHL